MSHRFADAFDVMTVIQAGSFPSSLHGRLILFAPVADVVNLHDQLAKTSRISILPRCQYFFAVIYRHNTLKVVSTAFSKAPIFDSSSSVAPIFPLGISESSSLVT